MSKGIKGDKINKVKRVNNKTVDVILKDGNIIRFYSVATDYGYDSEIRSKAVYEHKSDY